jgi:hypothetical protein
MSLPNPSSKSWYPKRYRAIMFPTMTDVIDENRPHTCYKVGLNCLDCTAESARQLALACKGLRGGMVGQLFVQIYSDPACAPMHAHFAASYRDASRVAHAAAAVA